MQIIISISEEVYEHILNAKSVPDLLGIDIVNTVNAVKNGAPLPNVLSELQTELLMTVDGGTDDKYLRYCDVCDRIEGTIKEFLEAHDADSD